MRTMIWQAGAAKNLSALGRAKKADAKRSQARAMIDEIAGRSKDEELRAMFVENAARRPANDESRQPPSVGLASAVLRQRS